MCWNKETSFLTLALGTVFNVLLFVSYPSPDVRILACTWQFVLMMQLFEGLSWFSREINYPELSDFSTKGAFVFNVLQPVFVALLCICITGSSRVKCTLVTLSVMYLVALLYTVCTTSFTSPLYGNSETCRHLQLYWWGHFPGSIFVLYMLLLACSCYSITPSHLGMAQFAYIVISLVVSSWLYPCTYGSIWCWFAAFAPVFTFCYLKMRPV